MPLLIASGDGIVIEMTDGTDDYNVQYRHDVGIFYDLVKASVKRMTIAQHFELTPQGAACIAVTPGWLRSEAMLDIFGVTEENWREATKSEPHFCISESPTYVARAVANLVADPQARRFGGTTVSSSQLARLYGFTDVDGTQPDCWRYMNDVIKTGLPASDTGYR